MIRRQSLFTRRNCSQRGEAALGIIGLMLGFAVLWWTFMKITGCLYEVKEERAAHMSDVLAGKKSVKEQEPEREPGGYLARCYGIDGDSCKMVYTTPTPYPPTPTPKPGFVSSLGR